MALLGFCAMNPISMMALLDSAKWKAVVYADTPNAKERYNEFKSNRTKAANKKTILLMFGVGNLQRVQGDFDLFDTVAVFDDVHNLYVASQRIEGFEIVDVVEDADVGFVPKTLSPSDLHAAIDKPGKPLSVPFVSQVTSALGKRRPSVLETTSRMPIPEQPPVSGVHATLMEVKSIIDAADTEIEFSSVVNLYVKFLFRAEGATRSVITTTVTKRLPEAAKDIWVNALDFAASDIGLHMAHAYSYMCRNQDPDFRVSHAIDVYGLKPYAGDFVYACAVIPPSESFRQQELPQLKNPVHSSLLMSISNTSSTKPKKKAKSAS